MRTGEAGEVTGDADNNSEKLTLIYWRISILILWKYRFAVQIAVFIIQIHKLQKMKIFLKKINLSTVDSRYYCSFWRCYWSWRSETRGIWNCWCVDRFCSKWPITERPQIKWQYPWLYLNSQNYINNWFDNKSIFMFFFKIIFHLIIIIFAPSFCFRVALVNVYVTIEFSEDDSDEDDNLRSSFRRKLAIWGIKEIRMCGNCGKTFLNHLMVL